ADAGDRGRGLLRGHYGAEPPGSAAVHVLVVHSERGCRAHLWRQRNLAGEHRAAALRAVAARAIVGRYAVGCRERTAGIAAAWPGQGSADAISVVAHGAAPGLGYAALDQRKLYAGVLCRDSARAARGFLSAFVGCAGRHPARAGSPVSRFLLQS